MASSYRKIYEQHYGRIPKDSDGRRYEVHHIDGNHKNDSPENLKAVSIQEHYDIHYTQGDWGACQAIAIRMSKSHKEIGELAVKAAQKRVAAGFLPPVHKGKDHPFYGKAGAATGHKWTDKQLEKISGENHWSYGIIHPKSKTVVIEDKLLNITIEANSLREWCKQNQLNHNAFRATVHQGLIYKSRYTYRNKNVRI